MRMAEQRAALSTRQFFIPHSDFPLPPSSNPFRGSTQCGMSNAECHATFSTHGHDSAFCLPTSAFHKPLSRINPMRNVECGVRNVMPHSQPSGPDSAFRLPTSTFHQPLSRITATSSWSMSLSITSRIVVSNPFRGSLPLHLLVRVSLAIERLSVSNPFRGSLPLHRADDWYWLDRIHSFQTPFEDHCHFILGTGTGFYAGNAFQTPFEDHCHFIPGTWPLYAAAAIRFKPLSRITATSSFLFDW